MKRALRWTPLLVALLSCADSGREALEGARRTWRSAEIVDYAYRYSTSGFAPPVDVRITVHVLGVTAVEKLGGSDVTVADAPTIESLFDDIAAALDRSDTEVRVEYDPRLGFPVQAHFSAGEEGDGFVVSELRTE
jgi:hypothetical protein